MANDEKDKLFQEFITREIDTMEIFLTGKASRTTITLQEFIAAARMQGISDDAIESELVRDLEEGGRIFGEFRSAVKATSNGIINRMRDSAQFSAIGIDTQYRWSAVLVNTCPDCLKRHGRVQDWADWEAEGLPRTGQTVCKENCRCVLLPAWAAELEPIKRERR